MELAEPSDERVSGGAAAGEPFDTGTQAAAASIQLLSNKIPYITFSKVFRVSLFLVIQDALHNVAEILVKQKDRMKTFSE